MTQLLLRMNRRTFSSVRKHRNYRLFLGGEAVSVTGTWMQSIAAAWLVLELTGSPVAVGILALCQFLPFTLFGLFAGVLVDRLDALRLVITTQLASMGVAVGLAGLTFAGAVEPWHVYVLTALRGTALVFEKPARQALTFRMVGPDELPNAVALNSSLVNATRVVGPAVGGLIVAAAGVAFCFAVNAVSFLAVLAALFLVRERELLPLDRGETRPSFRTGLAEGFAYVRRSRVAGVVFATVLVVSTLAFNFNVLLPVLAKQTLAGGPEVFGVISAWFGAGAVVGALLAASLGRASTKVLLFGAGGFGLAELALFPQTSVVAASTLLFVIGMFFTLWTANANATLQLAAPERLHGRVVSFYYFAFNGGAPLGGLLAGWLAATGGTALAFAVAGTAAIVTAAGAYALLRPTRAWERGAVRAAVGSIASRAR